MNKQSSTKILPFTFTNPTLKEHRPRYQNAKRFTCNQYKNEIEKKVTLLVDQHVRSEQTRLVQSCLNEHIFDEDDISNGCIYYDSDDNELTGDTLAQAKKSADFDLNTYYVDLEIEAWFLVSDWLAYHLHEKGETILENDYGCWWGLSHWGNWKNDPILQRIAQENCFQ